MTNPGGRKEPQETAKRQGQKGFMLLELIIVMGIIGILASIAVPRYTRTLALSRTTRIQADLQVINSAIVLYQAEKGKLPSNIATDLADYIVDADKLKPPQGTAYLNDGTPLTVDDAAYELYSDNTEATCEGHKLGEFVTK